MNSAHGEANCLNTVNCQTTKTKEEEEKKKKEEEEGELLTLHHNKWTCLYRTTPTLQHIFKYTTIKPHPSSEAAQQTTIKFGLPVNGTTSQQPQQTKHRPTSNSPSSRHTHQPQLRANLQTYHEKQDTHLFNKLVAPCM
jgi:hypothetical protein